jgi:hypothetical protein
MEALSSNSSTAKNKKKHNIPQKTKRNFQEKIQMIRYLKHVFEVLFT